MTESVLRIDHCTMQFGGVVAVDDLCMEINKDEIVALIGPNGAGKSTLLLPCLHCPCCRLTVIGDSAAPVMPGATGC